MTREFTICIPHQNFISMNRSRRIRWGWGGAFGMYGQEAKCIQFWWGNVKERGHLEDTSTDGRIILNSSRLGLGAEARSCGHSTEPSSYKKGEEFLEWLSNY